MKRSKFSDSQIIYAVKRVEYGTSVPEICRKILQNVLAVLTK